MDSSNRRLSIGLWALALACTGFAAGFFGPMLVNPEANQGPLVGIFITGPGGALSGFVLGAIFRVLPISNATNAKALLSACVLLALGTLFYCLPEPKLVGYVLDAEVAECAAPREYARAAMTNWQHAVERTTWYTPPANWKDTALRNIDEADGVVVTLNIARRAAIYEHRKPWNRGRKTAGAWSSVSKPERYYANDDGRDCVDYVARPRQLYTPFVNGPSDPNQPSPTWPPTDVTGFLQMMQLGPVPVEYQRLIGLK